MQADSAFDTLIDVLREPSVQTMRRVRGEQIQSPMLNVVGLFASFSIAPVSKGLRAMLFESRRTRRAFGRGKGMVSGSLQRSSLLLTREAN